jgi:hypothetical protein
MLVKEIATIKPLTPKQAQIAALKKGVDSAKDRLDAERKKQKVAKAQQRLQTAVSAT